MSLDSLFDALSSVRSTTRRDAHSGSMWELPGCEDDNSIRCSNQPTLSAQQVEALLMHDWRARREIVQWAGDLTRAGVEIEGLPEWVDAEALQSWLEGDDLNGKCGLLGALSELWAEGESYGGAVLVAVLDDGLRPSDPVDPSRIARVKSWEVLDRWCVWPYRRHIGGPVDYWLITDHTGELTPGSITRSSQIVHPSRVVVHYGSWMPKRWRVNHNGWGISRLEITRVQRDALARGLDSTGNLLERAAQDVLKMAELAELQEAVGPTYVGAQLAKVKKGLDTADLLVIDGGIEPDAANGIPGRRGDEFQTMSRPLAGASDIDETLHKEWRMGSGMPEIVADGTASGGLNSGEEAGQWKSHAANVKSEQDKNLTPWLNWGLGFIFASKAGPTAGVVPPTWKACWKSIAEPDHKLEAEVAEAWARVDGLQRAFGLPARDIRQWRNVDGKQGVVRLESADVLPEPTGEKAAAQTPARLDQRDHPLAGVFAVLPAHLARQFPWKPEDPTPPHVTLLHVGPTACEQINAVREVAAQMTAGVLPLSARLGPLEHFDQRDGRRVAYVAVEFGEDMTALSKQMREELQRRGVMVTVADRPTVMHATLAYLAPGEEYEGPVPVGEWTVERFEVWHGGD